MIITIDGPTASGKSTMGRMLADHFGFQYLNSGALYRALGYELMEKGYSLDQLQDPFPEDIAYFLAYERLQYVYSKQGERVLFDGDDIWPYLKSSVIDQAASIVSMHPAVRAETLKYQRRFAQDHDVIVDGRDCGSVVFPEAQIKFFLKAGLEERATRWQLAQQERGTHFGLLQATLKVAERDDRDMHRTNAPLIVPEGAIIVDNSMMNIEQTLAYMIDVIQTYLLKNR